MSASTVYHACESAASHLPTTFSTLRKERLHRCMFRGLVKKPLGIVSHPALQGTEGHIVPKDLKYISSYNWIDAPTPTIIVPGSPPIWAEKPTPLTVPRDSGTDFIDQNGYRMKGKFLLLPLIRAVQVSTTRNKVGSKFDWSSVDFVADSKCLRKLFAWAHGRSDHWRIDTQLAGNNTVLMNSWLLGTRQTSGWSESHGFNFEKAFTHPAPGCEGGTGHCRIVAYDFGGLQMVVRFEVDACLPLHSAKSQRKSARSTPPPSLSTPVIKKTALHFPHVNVIRAGSRVPQSHLIELKTHSTQSGKGWANSYPQLFLSQTPHMYRGIHKNGRISEIKKFTLGEPHLEPTDQKAQVGFKKLKVLLTTIQELVVKYGVDGRISLVCEGKELGLYQREGAGSCLPKYALALFRS